MRLKGLIGLIAVCFLTITAYGNDWKEKLVRQGIYKYKYLEELNDRNDKAGKSYLNQYVIELDTVNWIEERPDKDILSKNFTALSELLRNFNNNRPGKDKLRFYVIVVNNFHAWLREKGSFTLPRITENLDEYIELPNAQEQYKKFKDDIAQIPLDILAAMNKEQYKERIVYFYGRIALYRLNSEPSFYCHDHLRVEGGRLEGIKDQFIEKARGEAQIANTVQGANSENINAESRIAGSTLSIIKTVNALIDGFEEKPKVDCSQSEQTIVHVTSKAREKNYNNAVDAFVELIKSPGPAQKRTAAGDYLVYGDPAHFLEMPTFIKEVVPDRIKLLASNSSHKLYVAFKEIDFAMPSSDWEAFAKKVGEKAKLSASDLLLVVPYIHANCTERRWYGLASTGIGISMPAVYSNETGVAKSMNAALVHSEGTWEERFNNAFSMIPKNHIAYDFILTYTGDLIRNEISRNENVVGKKNIVEVRILEDERYDELYQEFKNYTTLSVGGAVPSPYGSQSMDFVSGNGDRTVRLLEEYRKNVAKIIASPPKYKLVEKTNLIESKINEKLAFDFTIWYIKHKKWGAASYLSSQESSVFYGGINPEKVQDGLALIDYVSLPASFFYGADVIFDVLGTYYAYTNGEYQTAMLYGAAAAIPFMSGAARRAIMEGSTHLLKTLKGTYVAWPKNMMFTGFMMEFKDGFKEYQFLKSTLNGKAFDAATKYKQEAQFLGALEEGMIVDPNAIKTLSDNPKLIDEFNVFYKENKGGLIRFLDGNTIRTQDSMWDDLAEMGDAGTLNNLSDQVKIDIVTRKVQKGYKSGWTKERVLSFEKPNRPLPETYLTKEYIEDHLKRFKNGVAFFCPENILINNKKLLGRTDGVYVVPMDEMDALMKETGGDIGKVEIALGIPTGDWASKTMCRIDVVDVSDLNLRVPSGNELGANNFFTPGGYTAGGQIEAVIDRIPEGKYKPTKIN
jgi:hypothetical protein